MCVYIRRRGNEKKFATKEEMKASPFLFLLKKNTRSTTTEELREEEEKRGKEGIKTYQGHGKKLMNC